MSHGNTIDGLHLIVDGNVPEPTVFSEENLRRMFEALVKALDMQLIHGPIFKQVELDPSKLSGDRFQDEGGISGYAMISTSHMSIHCWPLRRTFMADLFSCKTFDIALARGIIESHLNPNSMSIRSVVRRPDIAI